MEKDEFIAIARENGATEKMIASVLKRADKLEAAGISPYPFEIELPLGPSVLPKPYP